MVAYGHGTYKWLSVWTLNTSRSCKVTSKKDRFEYEKESVKRSEVQKRVFVFYTSGNGQTAPDNFKTHFHTVPVKCGNLLILKY